ncbi:hypothetical protein RFI_34762 [Reticulomyxa filosa]|uniref:Uncharacterized protein n=1 Tax=Reticulomyxa filosa TaxID=46433 RepID=X6LMN8_RETFI|nr:hypothetical protein RFI_34762 [Reticulomyxa filosa]|eukprot:ETO02656.1 hypothetical protein RFI_34762 [Reticulomyxa filosa]
MLCITTQEKKKIESGLEIGAVIRSTKMFKTQEKIVNIVLEKKDWENVGKKLLGKKVKKKGKIDKNEIFKNKMNKKNIKMRKKRKIKMKKIK